MIPIDQAFVSDHKTGINGDCQRACIASLLEIPLQVVPHFLEGLAPDDGLNFNRRLQSFLQPFGLMHLEASYIDFDVLRVQGAPDCYHMIYGQSSRGLRHAVVAFNGHIVHDPHPSKDGLVEEHKNDWTYGFLISTGANNYLFHQRIVRRYNEMRAAELLKKVRDAHWEFKGHGEERVLDGEWCEEVDKVLAYFNLNIYD